jgi:hypothetical protein
MKNKYETFTYETEIEVNEITYFVSGTLDASIVDNGIGDYEFWGARGTDHYYQWELDDYNVDVVDEDENEIEDDKLLKEIYSAFEEKAQSYLSELDVD